MRSRIRSALAQTAAVLSLAACAHGGAQQAPRDPAACLAPGVWHSLEHGAPRPAAAPDMLGFAARRDIVLLGEKHDERDHHAWQLQTLAALHALRPRMVIGFESFPRRVQGALDKWVAGELTEREFLEQADWHEVWSLPPDLYMPLFRFARINRIPMAALNVDRDLIRQIAQKGWDDVPEERREGVSRPAPASQAYIDALFETYLQHPRIKEAGRAASRSDRDFLRFVDSQTAWDRAMAEALARRAESTPGSAGPLVVGIIGAGHVGNGHGVPHQLRDLGVSRIATLMPISAADSCQPIARGFADGVFALPAAPREASRTARLGVSLQRAGTGVEVVDVAAGSLAESSGIRKGDLIVSVAGAAASRTGGVAAAIRAQPAGTWLPITIRREGKSLDLIVKFPPAS